MSEFDSIMLRVEVGGNRKLRRFTPEERWCAVAGVWALAAKSPVRGYLLIAENVPVEPQDIAEQAGVKLSAVKSTLKKMRELGMLEADDELKTEHVHDWHIHQKEPKPSETREAWRIRKREQRAGKRDGPGGVPSGVPRDTPSGVPPQREEKRSKEKGITPPTPPQAGGRQRDHDRFEREMTEWVEQHPVTVELTQIWAPIAARIAEIVDGPTYRLHLASLHLHEDGETLVIGGANGATWVTERFGKVIQVAAHERPIKVIDCGCSPPAQDRPCRRASPGSAAAWRCLVEGCNAGCEWSA